MNLIALSIIALTMGHVFSNAVRTLPAIAADVLQRDLGITADGLAALTGAFPATFALAMLPVGVALDRWGVKPTALCLLTIAAGGAVLAAQAMGADFAYIGSAFIATTEARAAQEYKQCIVDSNSDDIVYSSLFTGVHGNYLAPSIRNAGLDPAQLAEGNAAAMDFSGDKTKAWKDIWGCGQGIGAVTSIDSTAALVARLQREYATAKVRIA
jgi:nitronate monooxygenase